MANELFLNMGHIIPMGQADLLADDAKPIYAKGQLSFVRDAFGLRVFRYLRNATATAVGKGELQSRAAAVTITNVDSGTVTSITQAALGATVDAYKDRLLICTDHNASAGAAPEGEVGVIVSNSATVINVDPKRPFSTAPLVNDDFSVYSLFDLKDGADGDLAINVMGIAMTAVGSGNWGCWQSYGFCPDVLHKNAAVTLGDPIVADVAQVGAFGADGQELWIGWSPNGMSADNVQLRALVRVNLFEGTGPGTAP